jgi:thioredoxin 1
MPDIAKVTDASFDAEVLAAAQPVLVDFYADWCAPCRALMPALEDIAREYDGELSIVKLNVDENVATRDRFGIASIPALLLFDKGELRQRIVGPPSRTAIAGIVDRLLSDDA